MGDTRTAPGDASAKPTGLFAIIALLALAAVAADVVLPPDVSAGPLYAGLLLSGWWLTRPGQILWLAGLATLLLMLGHLAAQAPSPAMLGDLATLAAIRAQALSAAPEAIDRGLALAALWAIAGVLVAAKHREVSLQRSRRAMAARLHERAARLAATRTEAEMARQSASALLNGVGHELRTPLNAVLGFSEILLKELFGPIGDPRYRGYIADIHDSGRHLLELIEGIMAMARVESGRIELREETIPVEPFLEACLDGVAKRARAGKIETELELPEALLPLRADRRKLRQALTNLLSNAVKFTPPGGRVVLRAWSEPGSGHVFQVEDSGVGMALKDVPQALAPLGQLDNPLRRRLEGAGLGLPLAKALV
ncbi:MAG TPA: HAMP domain-containing sensor histidine kinase, partial [Kiloniellales bacterium]|nr:HAMP domain-containing sensor histidine kinase [Kiloniellales bacterium]